MKQTLRIFMLLAVAVLTAGQAWAGSPSTPRVKFVYAANHGTAVASEANGKVTITINPVEGWRAIDGDVTAVATVANSSVAEARRAEAAEDESIGLGGETIAVTCTATNAFTLKLPEDDNKNVLVTVNFHACESVSYINAEGVLCDGADGHSAKATAYVLTGSETTLAAGWYVADGEVSFNQQLTASGDVHIILKDGAAMSIGTAQSPVSGHGIHGNGHSISIYAQSTGDSKGKLLINASQFGIFAEVGNVGIYGGEVTATGSTYGEGIFAIKSGSTGGSITLSNATVTASGGIGIDARGGITINSGTVTANGSYIGIQADKCDLTINGGKVTATGTSDNGIYANGGNVEISGGEVTATGGGVSYGICASKYNSNGGNITIGWTAPADFINASSYSAAGTITLTKDFTDIDGGVYSGTVSASAINGKTLRPYNGPRSLTVANITKTSATLSWTAGGEETQWRVSLSADNGSTWSQPVTVDENQYVLDLTGLSAGTAVRVKVESVLGEGVYSAPATITFGTPIDYLDISGTTQTCSGYTVLNGSETTLAAGWYVANGEVSFNQQLTASGDVHIILKDGAVMSIGTAQSPVSGHGIYGNGHSISIYAQSTGDSKGKLQINASQFGIFAEGGNVGICGGEVTATGNNGCDGIFAYKRSSTGGSITLSNATVTASGVYGIDARGGLTINSGTVTANGSHYGIQVMGSDLTIKGGKVTATGTSNNGIYASGVNVEISGGEVEATGGNGIYASNGSVSVTDATITAGGVYAYKGITFDGSSVTVSGVCYNASSGDIIIQNGSSVTSTASGDGSLDNDGGSISISGSEVDAQRKIRGVGGVSLTNAIVKVEESDASIDAIYAVNNGLRIDGSTVTTTGKIFAERCDISICNGSKVIVTGGIYVGNSSKNLSISNSEVEFTDQIFSGYNLTIDGSKVTAIGNGSGEIYAVHGVLTLGWSHPDDCIYAKTYGTYDGSLVIADGKTFIDETGNTYSGTMDKVEDAYPIDGKTLRPYNGGPLSLTATTVTKTSATLSWTAGDEQAQWVVSWSTDNGSTWSDPVTVDKKQYELTGLSAGRKVCVEVKTVLGENEYSFPATITFCTPIDYLDISGTTQTCSGYTVLTGSETTLAAGWYVADGEVSFNQQLTASGDVHIILKDGAVMSIGTAQSPVSGHGIYASSRSISIYAQSTGDSKGKLQINASDNGIYASGGNVGISGGEVEATGGGGYDGIYATKSGSTGGSITLTNATVTASGAYGILAQGGLIINSGTVTSNGSATNEGHGICASGCDITINGGKVTATATLGNGIYAPGGNVEINGGEVEATGSAGGFGIYATKSGANGGCITLSNATVTASGAVGILAQGGIIINSGTVTANGNLDCAITASGCDLTINGGKVTATATSAYGIYAPGGNVKINGGEVEATGSLDGYGIYAFKKDGNGGCITLTNATVTASGGTCIYAQGGLIINSGTVTANGSYGILASGCDLTINGGKVTATATNGYGIYAYGGNVEISGGEVDATGSLGGYGIYAFKKDGNGGCITLGWTDASDYIHANGYFANGGTLSIASGKTFIDEAGNTYGGTITKVEDAYPIDGKTLRPYIAQEITIGTSGWATWCSSKEYTLPDGLTAYTVSGLSADGKSVVLTPAETIMADTPLLLKGTAGETYAALWSADGEATGLVSKPVGNVLTFYGNPTDEAITTGYTYEFGKSYVLYQGAFVLVDSDKGLPAHKCLLTLTTAAARQLSMSIGDETTGITTTNYTNSTNSEEAWYSIDGRKLQSKPATKGLYIYKGKKRIVR